MIKVLLLAFLLTPVAYAQTYYVTGGGSHNNDCLSWKTACSVKGINPLAKAGDTVIIRDSGDYVEWNSNLKLVNGGTAKKHITIKAEGNIAFINREFGWAYINTPYVDIINIGCKGGVGSCVSINSTNHVTVTGMVAMGMFRGVDIRKSSDNTVQFSAFIGNREGVYISHDSNRNTLKANLVRDNGHGEKGDRCGLCVGEKSAGVDNTVTRNIFFKNGGLNSDNAFAAYDAPRTTVTHNYFEANHRGALMVTQYSFDSFVAWNTIIGNGTSCKTESNISNLSVRNKSDRTIVLENVLKNNCVAHGNRWGDKSPRCDMDVIGWGDPQRPTENISFIRNTVEGTMNGKAFCINEKTLTNGIVIY